MDANFFSCRGKMMAAMNIQIDIQKKGVQGGGDLNRGGGKENQSRQEKKKKKKKKNQKTKTKTKKNNK